jgi:hypothetical protein
MCQWRASMTCMSEFADTATNCVFYSMRRDGGLLSTSLSSFCATPRLGVAECAGGSALLSRRLRVRASVSECLYLCQCVCVLVGVRALLCVWGVLRAALCVCGLV